MRNRPKITPAVIGSMKGGGVKIACLTAYDYPTARLLDDAGVHLILVGDSLGMVVLGHPDTTQVTLADMEHHVRAVARANPKALLVADLPIGTYNSPEQAVVHSRRLIASGAEAVKAEGGREILPQVKAIVSAGIPFLGHLGMLPQHVVEEGGYRIKGKSAPERERLFADARALAEAGAFAVVLELVTAAVARELTATLAIPTIGIGSGPGCDGQILVTPDLIGLQPWIALKHVKPKLQTGEQIFNAVREWQMEIQQT